jgi:hypothetical protein
MRKITTLLMVIVALLAVIALLMLASATANAHWKPEYSAMPAEIQGWFKSLRSPRGMPCCDTADGQRVEDPDWERDDAGYRVRLDGAWNHVDFDQVVDEPNRVGYAIVWRYNGKITCFLPGASG